MPSHRRRIHRSRSNRKPIIIVGLLIAIVAIAIVVVYSTMPSSYTLTIYTEGQGNVLPGNGTYTPGTTIDLKAINAANWTFYEWTGDSSNRSNTSIAMNGHKVVNATFVENKNKVLLTTSMGNITIQLRGDMPITTGNFKKLITRGIYGNTIFHRVIADFMIQGGDPTGTGAGDPSIPSIQDEFTGHNANTRGTIAMANVPDQPNSGSSQFFINVVYNDHLDGKHPVFGEVISGMDVVDAISQVETDSNDRPLQNVTLIKAILID